MTVAELIERLKELPPDLEVRYDGGSTYFPVFDLTIESQMRPDPMADSWKFALIEEEYILIT